MILFEVIIETLGRQTGGKYGKLVSEPHSSNSSLSEPHTRKLNVNELHTHTATVISGKMQYLSSHPIHLSCGLFVIIVTSTNPTYVQSVMIAPHVRVTVIARLRYGV